MIMSEIKIDARLKSSSSVEYYLVSLFVMWWLLSQRAACLSREPLDSSAGRLSPANSVSVCCPSSSETTAPAAASKGNNTWTHQCYSFGQSSSKWAGWPTTKTLSRAAVGKNIEQGKWLTQMITISIEIITHQPKCAPNRLIQVKLMTRDVKWTKGNSSARNLRSISWVESHLIVLFNSPLKWSSTKR